MNDVGNCVTRWPKSPIFIIEDVGMYEKTGCDNVV